MVKKNIIFSLKNSQKFNLDIQNRFLLSSQAQNTYFLLFLTFLAHSSEMLYLFHKWYFQAIGREKLGLKIHMPDKSQFSVM